MHRLCLLTTCLVLLAAPALGQASRTPVDTRELRDQSFHVGGLELTISKLDGNVVISSDVRDGGVGYVTLRVANVSGDFERFDPSRFVVVGSDGRQATPAYERRNTDRAPVGEISVAPRARAEVKYNLSARVRFPAEVYYDGALLAVVTD